MTGNGKHTNSDIPSLYGDDWGIMVYEIVIPTVVLDREVKSTHPYPSCVKSTRGGVPYGKPMTNVFMFTAAAGQVAELRAAWQRGAVGKTW